MSQQTVYLFVFDTLADWEAGFAIAHINQPEHQKNPGRYQIRTVGLTRDPVRSLGGVTIVPDLGLADLRSEGTALLILPGGTVWDAEGIPAATDKARELLAAGVPVAAICGATAGLARAGLLDDRAHTSNARDYLEATDYKGAAHYRDTLAVTDRDVITASGLGALEFAREIFRLLDVYPEPMLDAWYGLFKGQPQPT
ncbi:type 1 glutamine amidotransferase family protein [Chondromyces crocatus]|uniref:Thiazole biosynthesis protein ThiJ n=1 Tax=Chondromyces crocatus TaxID=52 RepID=A0A0K1EJR9_CHOCO|nr:type 1 glutamine amidotransferase family protein [Chondromyces crocatus]AKT41094.1 thiazole biosynthesis protein ThiJ [Chondromyces crocatus]